jgi:Aminoglycoside N3''-acetyltransferase
VLFLGTTHATNTSLHLAEYRADRDPERVTPACAMLVDGEREWVEFEDIALKDSDFPDCGAAFEERHPRAVETGTVGVGSGKRLSQPTLVDFAVEWFETNRA